MPAASLAIALLALAAAYLLTGRVRRAALATGLIDHPNARSSHSQPTPRGGGLAIVLASLGAIAVLALLRIVDGPLAGALLGGGAVVAAVGFIDDRRSLPVRVRMVAHVAAAAWALWLLGGLPLMRVGDSWWQPGWVGFGLGIIGIVWSLNLFNFMDGIDGIAGSEAIFVAAGGAAVGALGGGAPAVPAAALAVAAATLGFLRWNWPPARIFMGDVGSGFLGFVLAVLAIAAGRTEPVALFTWFVLGALFTVDATVTVTRRFLRRERVAAAHRTHAYQWLARRWGSHRRVTLLAWAINLLWLAPGAWACHAFPRRAGLVALVVAVPLVIGCRLAGAGRAERDESHD